jgi:hypothetical protein
VCVCACSITGSEAKQYNTKQNRVLISTKIAQNGRLQLISSLHFFFGLALPLVSLDLLCFLLFSRDVRRKGKSRINSDGTKGLPTKTLCTLAMSMFRVGLSLNHEAPSALDIWERWMEPTARVCSERP